MKKLMILLVTLAMVNVASAGIVDIVISSLNGNPITPTKEITIRPSDTINFDIVYQAPADWFAWSLSLELVVSGPGVLTNAVDADGDLTDITWPTGYWNMDLAGGLPMSRVTKLPNGNALLDTLAKDFGTVPPGIILDHFLMHCEGPGDVILTLVENPDTRAKESLESDWSDLYHLNVGTGVIIHQIPEPMTLTLLGLGSLFLARRKK